MKLTRSHKIQALTDVINLDKEQRYTGPSFRLETLSPVTFNEKTQLREIDNLLVLMDGLSDTALTLKKMYLDLKMKNDSRKNECMRKVVLFKERLKHLADDFERHISGELEYIQHAESVQIDSRIEECESMFSAIEMSKDLTQVMKTEYITPQTISKVNAARQRCNEYKFTLQRIHSKLQPVQYNLAIDRNLSDALNSTPGIIGKVEVSHDNDDFFGDRTAKLTRHSSSATNTNAESGSTIRPHMNSDHAQKVNDLYLQQKDDHGEPMLTSICTLNNNHFVSLDRNNNKLLLVHQDGITVTSYVFTSQIWDMTLIDEVTLAVTVPDNDKIVLVKVRNKNLCAERLIKTSNICYGICAIEGFIVVTTKGGYVKIVTKAGEEVASLRHNTRGEVLFTDPQHVATNREQNELYVTDYTLHTVTALFLTGVKIDPQPKFVFRNNELRNPTGLCLDMSGHVYVCGYSSHNLLKLSSDGRLLLVLVSGIMNPQTVAFTHIEDQLFVSYLSSGGHSKHMQNVIGLFRI